MSATILLAVRQFYLIIKYGRVSCKFSLSVRDDMYIAHNDDSLHVLSSRSHRSDLCFLHSEEMHFDIVGGGVCCGHSISLCKYLIPI